MRSRFLLVVLLCCSISAFSQYKKYVKPTDTAVLNKLAQWQDMKFGLFMHWGTYSQWGIVESWSICPEDEGWTQRKGPYSQNYFEYVKAYENLQATFNPVKFQPEKWVKAAKDAGMKYMIFTTKHHDGFSMFDTKETDYKITDVKTPFSKNPRSNVTKEIFNAFRKDGFAIGAYFSKPDWHNKDYWWPYFPPKDRNVNYEPTKYPQRWESFKNFTYNQIKELMSEYGKVDILWLDGGWVRPLSTVDTTVEWQRTIRTDQDIDMKRIAEMARGYQPGLLVVDRTVTGEYENYTTPEQEVPHELLPYPWESCITMGDSWSYVPNDHYKPAQKIVQMLIRIVSRGGNLLLNIGPGPDGDWDPNAYVRLQQIGAWMKINGEAIHGSMPLAPYEAGNIHYTQSKDGKKQYAFLLSEKEEVVLPAQVTLTGVAASAKSRISILGSGAALKWKVENGNTIVEIPTLVKNKWKGRYAVVFKMEGAGL
ncbi:MAG: alpha-L-fucosidase [Chitinophagaceae bacterium]|nr:alpha-L-fucosidase [Chitinophagaceae bacterium]